MKAKPTLITTIEMEVAIAKYFNFRKNIIVPNISWGFDIHECDLFVIRNSGFAVEVEIKISRSDLLKDFKKEHNHYDVKHRIAEFYYALPNYLYESCRDIIPDSAGIIICEKHSNYKNVEIITASLKKRAKRIKDARILTEREQMKIARLGAMRIWSLKEKNIRNGRDKKI